MARLRGVCYTSTCTCYFLKADYTPVATGITAASLGIFQVQCSAVILATSFGGKEAILSTLSPWLLSAATARSLLPRRPRSSSSSLEEHGRSRHTPALLRPTAAAPHGFLGIGQFLYKHHQASFGVIRASCFFFLSCSQRTPSLRNRGHAALVNSHSSAPAEWQPELGRARDASC